MSPTKNYPTFWTTILFATVAALAAVGAMPAPAAAYVGPGAALSLLGALWGLLVAIGAAVAFAVAWPIRRYLRSRRDRGVKAPSARRRGPQAASRT